MCLPLWVLPVRPCNTNPASNHTSSRPGFLFPEGPEHALPIPGASSGVPHKIPHSRAGALTCVALSHLLKGSLAPESTVSPHFPAPHRNGRVPSNHCMPTNSPNSTVPSPSIQPFEVPASTMFYPPKPNIFTLPHRITAGCVGVGLEGMEEVDEGEFWPHYGEH